MRQQPPHPAEIAIPPLLGRAGVFSQRKIFQLFTQILDDDGEFVALPDTAALMQGMGWYAAYLPQTPGDCGDGLAPRLHKCERLWRVSTAAQSIWRGPNQTPMRPLTPAQFEQAETPGAPALTPVAGVMGGNGWFRAWVQANDNTGNRKFFMDLDETVELYAFDVKVMLVGPPGAINVTDFNNAQIENGAQLVGTVLDLRVGASIQPIESPTGLREVRSTEFVPVPQGTAVVIPVPRFARAVKVYQDNVGAAAGPWTRQAQGLNLGLLNFTNRASNDEEAELGRENQLLTDTDNLNDRRFVVQWTIVPG